MADVATPESAERTAAVLAAATAAGRPVRIAGAGTKSRWGLPPRHPDQILLSTARLDDPPERTGHLVRVGAGTPLARVQDELAAVGRRVPLDPARADTATVGGIVATDDAGPLAHRYGTPRRLVRAVTVALSDGSVIRADVSGDQTGDGRRLARLLCGSFGTLGALVEVTLRCAPVPERTLTVLGLATAPEPLAAAAAALAAAPFALEALDLAWRGGRGGLLAQVSGPHAVRHADRAAFTMRTAGLRGVEITAEDAALWERQRAGQRSSARCLLRVATRPSRLAEVLTGADRHGGTVVGRAGLGTLFVELGPAQFGDLRDRLGPGTPSVLLDVPPEDRGALTAADVWGPQGRELTELTRSIKHAFDPTATCNPGIFAAGI